MGNRVRDVGSNDEGPRSLWMAFGAMAKIVPDLWTFGSQYSGYIATIRAMMYRHMLALVSDMVFAEGLRNCRRGQRSPF